jgi:hypothetical protein
VILGKANLTESANFIAIDMPAGYRRAAAWLCRLNILDRRQSLGVL